MDTQKFCLKWDDFHSSVTSLLNDLRLVDEFCDITLCCDGARLGAHRVLLSACSPYFRQVLKNNACQQHMVFFIKGATPTDLHALVEFIYRGSVNLAQNQLASFIRTAEMLQIRGLSGDGDKSPLVVPSSSASPTPTSGYRPPSANTPHQDQQHRLPPNKRQRLSADHDGQDSVLHLSASSPGTGVGGGGDPDSVSSCASNQSPPPPPSSSSSSAVPHHYQSLQSHSSVPQHPLALAYHHQQQQHGVDPSAAISHHQHLTHHHHQQLPTHHHHHQSSQFKVEKVEMAGEDDDVGALGCLEATLGQVAKYEGVFGSGTGGNSSSGGGGSSIAAASARLQSQPAVLSINEVHSHMMPGYSDNLAGTSQSIINSIDDTAAQALYSDTHEDEDQGDEDRAIGTVGSILSPLLTASCVPFSTSSLLSPASGGAYQCRVCGRQYSRPQSLTSHMRLHQGLTRCSICGKVMPTIPLLRQHLEQAHKLMRALVLKMVPRCSSLRMSL